MTFAAIAQLISGQRPFYIYLFRKGGVEYRYTSLPSDLTRSVAGVTGTIWTAAPIFHGTIPYSSDSARSEFPITLPLSDAFARSFLAPVGLEPATVTLWKGFLNDPDAELVVQYKGSVLGAKPSEGGTISITCMSDISGLRRKGLTAVIQRPCRHGLYHGGCGLALAAFQTDASLSAITVDGLTLTVSAAAAQASGYFRAGILEWNGAREMIISHTGASLRLQTPVPGLVEAFAADGAQAVKIAPGCDLTRTTCATRFGNLTNFGGFPWISDNPFDGRSIF